MPQLWMVDLMVPGGKKVDNLHLCRSHIEFIRLILFLLCTTLLPHLRLYSQKTPNVVHVVKEGAGKRQDEIQVVLDLKLSMSLSIMVVICDCHNKGQSCD